MKQYFEGWYFKHQCSGNTLCLIPGRAADGAFIQVLTNEASYTLDYPLSAYHKTREAISVGGSTFSRNGIDLAISTEKSELTGAIQYDGITPLKYNIMGPFALLPMQTRHNVISMNHSLKGTLNLNGTPIPFDGGKGYIEGDRGRSFPKSYAWAQCNDFQEDCSIMLSIAQIPLAGRWFWGCIGVVWLDGREYRFATYKGVQIRESGARTSWKLHRGHIAFWLSCPRREGTSWPRPSRGK